MIKPESIITDSQRKSLLEDRARKNITRTIDVDVTIEDLIEAANRRRPLLDRIKSFISGQSRLGATVGSILDVVTIFVPWGNAISKVRKVIKRKTNPMLKLNDKAWYQSKTYWSAIIVLLTGLLQMAGVGFVENPEVMQTIYTIIYHVAAALGLVGLRDAVDKKKVTK